MLQTNNPNCTNVIQRRKICFRKINPKMTSSKNPIVNTIDAAFTSEDCISAIPVVKETIRIAVKSMSKNDRMPQNYPEDPVKSMKIRETADDIRQCGSLS